MLSLIGFYSIHNYIPFYIMSSWILLEFISNTIPIIPTKIYRKGCDLLINKYDILNDLKFSKEFPDPKIQGAKAYLMSKGKTETQAMKLSTKFIWKLKQKRLNLSVKYGLSYNISEHFGYIILLPFCSILFNICGMNNNSWQWLFTNETSYLNIFNNRMYFVYFFQSYIMANYFMRIIAPFTFRFFALPLTEKKYMKD